MSEDARFEDGREAPLRLKAIVPDEVPVISALVQDAVFPASEMRYDRGRRRFAVLLNRFRWEEGARGATSPERVQAVLAIEDVMRVQTQGVQARGARPDADMVLSVLALEFEPGEDGTGRVEIILAGDGAIALDVEALELTLRDVTKPYLAPSGAMPKHPE